MKPIQFKDFVFEPQWQYENPVSGSYYRSGIVHGVLLYSELGGNIQANDAEKIIPTLDRLFAESGISGNTYCRIANYTNVERTSFKVRHSYMKTIKRLNRQYGCTPAVTYICGASIWSRTVLLFGEKQAQQNFVFMSSAEEALDHYNKNTLCSKGPTAAEESDEDRKSISQKDIDFLVRLAGSIVWVDSAMDMPPMPEFNPLYPLYLALNTISIDMRENKRQLQISEERLGMVLSVANDGIWDWNLEDDSILFDARYYTMAGYDPADFPCALDEWKTRVHPEDIGQTMQDVQEHLRGTRPEFKVEFRFRRKDGDYMWILGRGKVVERNEDGKALRFIGTHSDITKLKQAQELLLKNLSDTERINKLMSGREERVVEMKREVNSLLEEMHREIRYKSVSDGSEIAS